MSNALLHSIEPADQSELLLDRTAALSRVAAENLAVAASLRATAWALAEAGLRAFRPELTEDQVQSEVRAQFRRASG